jgi:hypothetical protein
MARYCSVAGDAQAAYRRAWLLGLLAVPILIIASHSYAAASIERARYRHLPTIPVTIVEKSRDTKVGFVAPVDTNGDGLPDNWAAVQGAPGDSVRVAVAGGEIQREPHASDYVKRALGLGVVAFILLLAAFAALRPALYARARSKFPPEFPHDRLTAAVAPGQT